MTHPKLISAEKGRNFKLNVTLETIPLLGNTIKQHMLLCEFLDFIYFVDMHTITTLEAPSWSGYSFQHSPQNHCCAKKRSTFLPSYQIYFTLRWSKLLLESSASLTRRALWPRWEKTHHPSAVKGNSSKGRRGWDHREPRAERMRGHIFRAERVIPECLQWWTHKLYI